MLSLLIDAWSDLSTERPIGMQTGLIPWSKICDWAAFHELDRDNTRLLVIVIRSVDIRRFDERAAKQRQDNLRHGPKERR